MTRAPVSFRKGDRMVATIVMAVTTTPRDPRDIPGVPFGGKHAAGVTGMQRGGVLIDEGARQFSCTRRMEVPA